VKPTHHPHRTRLRGFGYLRRLGPGLVTGASDDDPSGIGTYSQVGAAFGFGLLWTALVSLPLAAAVQETAARLGLVTGKGLAVLIKERFPRWVLFSAVLLVVCANVFNIGADLGSMAASIRELAPIPYAPLVVLLAGAILGVEIFVPYRRYSGILRWLTLSLVAYIAVLFVIKVNWGQVVRDVFIPSIHGDRVYLVALIAVFGTTISPYLFFWQASEEVEEELEHNESLPLYPFDKGHLRAMRVDVVAGMTSAVVVMFAIMVASAATLHTHGITTIQTADQAARALRPIAGPVAGLLFALGIVGTGALAVPVLAGSSAYAIAETFGWREGLSRTFREAVGFYGSIAAAMTVGLVLGFIGIDPIRALYYSAILNGLAAPPLILLMLILSRSTGTCGPWRGGGASTLLLVLAFLVMAGLPIAYLIR
jgi:NRAMP (natural resistance-associated macrophage protein)-like metal ion transporter